MSRSVGRCCSNEVMSLTSPAIAVRLRRLWAGEIVTSDELMASVLSGDWHGVELERKGPNLTVVGPGSGRAAIKGPLGDLLARRAREVTGGAITSVQWRASSRFTPARRDRTTDVDVFNVEDPLLETYPEILADVRSSIPTSASPEACAAVGALRLVGASRHRLWFAAETLAARDALGTVPGARAALVVTVQNYQAAKRPLHHVLIDPSYRAKQQRLLP